MNHALILPIVMPLVAAGVLVALPLRAQRVQRALGVAATLAQLPVAVWLAVRASAGGIAVYTPGAWPAPFGIALQLDRLGALMLVLTAVLALACVIGTSTREVRRDRYFRALFQFELMGINGAFLAGDLFNLFVFFELLLIASYALLLHGGGRERVKSGLHYLLLNLVGSCFFLIAVGVLYGLTGTLNMADMGERLAHLDAAARPLGQFAGAMLMLVFALKAAVFPLSFWLPNAYRSAMAPVAALFAIMTKVGIYAMLRCDALVFGAAGGLLTPFMRDWAWWLALATIAFGALGALAVSSLKSTTGYVVLVSVGLLFAAATLQTAAAWSALLYYLVSTTLCSAALFLLADTVEPETPSVSANTRPPSRAALDDTHASAPAAALDGDTAVAVAAIVEVARPARAVTTWPSKSAAVLFLCLAVGAAGLPPLSGFLGKAMILAAAPIAQARTLWPAVLVSGLLLIVALSRTGTRLFWAIPASEAYAAAPHAAPHGARKKLAACALLLACVIAATLGAGPLKRWLDASAAQLLDRAAYVHAVLRAPANG